MSVLQKLKSSADYRFIIGLMLGVLLTGLVLPFTIDRSSTRSTTRASTRGGGGATGAAASGATSDGSSGISSPGAAAVGTSAGGSLDNGGNFTGGAGGPLTNSDQGVTADSIKIGIPLLDLGALSATGLVASNGSVQDRQAAWQALIDAKNEAGGVGGRKINPVFAPFGGTDPDQAEAQADCEKFARDDQVFAVLPDAAFFVRASSCVTVQHQIPLLGFQSVDQSVIEDSGNLMFLTTMTNDRTFYNHIMTLHERGLLKGKTIGLVTEESLTKAYDDLEIPLLQRLGYSITYRANLSADLSTAQGQIPIEVSQMRTHNVDFIIYEAGALYVQFWANQADKQAYYPQHSLSDFQGGTDNFGLQSVSGRFDAVGWGQRRKLGYRTTSETPDETTCRQIVESRTSLRLDRNKDLFGEVMRYCTQLDQFVAAASAVGPNLTRPAFAASLQALGPFHAIDVGPPADGSNASFSGSKSDAPDYLHELKVDTSCRCWIPVADWIPARVLGG